jgi:hypothetical protein
VAFQKGDKQTTNIDYGLATCPKTEKQRYKMTFDNFFQQTKIYVENSNLYPSKEYIKSQIQALLRYTEHSGLYKQIRILDHEEQEIQSVDELVDRYYNNPEDYFFESSSRYESQNVYLEFR